MESAFVLSFLGNLSGEWQPTPVFLPGESHGQRSLAGYSPRDRKELDMTERLSTQSLFNRFCDEEWAPKLTADGLWDNEMPR